MSIQPSQTNISFKSAAEMAKETLSEFDRPAWQASAKLGKERLEGHQVFADFIGYDRPFPWDVALTQYAQFSPIKDVPGFFIFRPSRSSNQNVSLTILQEDVVKNFRIPFKVEGDQVLLQNTYLKYCGEKGILSEDEAKKWSEWSTIQELAQSIIEVGHFQPAASRGSMTTNDLLILLASYSENSDSEKIAAGFNHLMLQEKVSPGKITAENDVSENNPTESTENI